VQIIHAIKSAEYTVLLQKSKSDSKGIFRSGCILKWKIAIFNWNEIFDFTEKRFTNNYQNYGSLQQK